MEIFLSRLWLSLLVLLSVAIPPVWAENKPLYRLEVRLQPEQQQVQGVARLNPSEVFAGRAIEFFLSPHAELGRVLLAGKPVDYTFVKGRLSVSIPSHERGDLEVEYRARYADPLPENTVGMENPSFGVSAVVGPTGTYLSPGTSWFPRPVAPAPNYRIRIEAPEGIYAVTSGKLLQHGVAEGLSFIEWETTFPLDGLALAAGPYQIFEDRVGTIQILTFLTERNADLASAYLDSTRKYLQFYQSLLGAYPFTKFAIVENFLPTGYGLPSWTLLGSNVIALPFIPYTSLPHEIVHSWFGNAVEVDYKSGNWAEGLTSYLADYLLQEQRSAGSGREHRLKLLRDYASLVPLERDYPLTRFVSRTSKLDQAVGYGKSAMIFHMLRQKIGEEAFWGALRSMTAEGNGRRLGWTDLQSYFSAAAGEELAPFFKMWIERPGAPQLSFDKVAVLERDGGWLVRGILAQTGPRYELSVPVRLKGEAGVTDTTVQVRQPRTPFALRTDAPPLQLLGDPDAQLFRRLHAEELPATINDLRASRQLRVVARSSDDPMLEASADLLRGLQQEHAPVVTWDSLGPELAENSDLLFIGWPGRDRLSKGSGLQALASENGFVWNGRTYQAPEESLFVCRRLPGEPGSLVAIFYPLSVDAARQVARKIPHYGRYSQLVFRGGGNLVKETAEPLTSPLRVDLQ